MMLPEATSSNATVAAGIAAMETKPLAACGRAFFEQYEKANATEKEFEVAEEQEFEEIGGNSPKVQPCLSLPGSFSALFNFELSC